MSKIVFIFGILLSSLALNAQTTTVNKKLKEYPDKFDLSTPLKAGITFSYFAVNGEESLWRENSSYFIKAYFPNKSETQRRKVDNSYKSYLLNATIKEVIVYKDSVACMITQNDTEDYSIRMLGFEDGRWLNIGEDLGESLEAARINFNKKANIILQKLRYTERVKTISADASTLVNYIKNKGIAPKEFLLKKLKSHPLVIYGELHRRKVSWDFLTNVLHSPLFCESVGTIFVELPSYQQAQFDRFYSSDTLQPKILLDILRSEQIYGWWDRGEYEFLIEVWKLNQTLPQNKRIRVIGVDEQLRYERIVTSEDYQNAVSNLKDRNTNMADVIENHLKTKLDKQNSLFIVGYAHAYKSHVPGGYSSAEGQAPALTAGAQLVHRLSEKNVFTILQHAPMGTNSGAVGLVRKGLFDVAFEKAGNKPVAFDLNGSPFGAEPFDMDYEICFDDRIGSFSDNFDGYIFINPLKEESSDYILYDIWDDDFVSEMKRRASIANFNLNRWLGISEEITKERIIEAFKTKYEGKKRWANLYEQ